jgi:hypothetical protein
MGRIDIQADLTRIDRRIGQKDASLVSERGDFRTSDMMDGCACHW